MLIEVEGELVGDLALSDLFASCNIFDFRNNLQQFVRERVDSAGHLLSGKLMVISIDVSLAAILAHCIAMLLVYGLVHHQRSRLAKALAAHRTLERLFFRVNVAMVPQMVLATERFAADVARIWPLVCVRPFMNQQIVGLGKLARAILANVLLALALAARLGRAGRAAKCCLICGHHFSLERFLGRWLAVRLGRTSRRRRRKGRRRRVVRRLKNR
ncbi:hypothetical protein BpHYR1_054379 [Brachionus plicatilis]|uniref:Uncharacterized protein n=1 Tax=Brachionus plicatilis TaxID=10195 RepID=A0A3M7QIL2_BRAPC|nr:hypothetical protein BpHYR1_054379 [Brachionus plicatilis]